MSSCANIAALRPLFGVLRGVCLLGALAAPARLAAQGTETEFAIRSWERRQGVPATVINQIQRGPNGYLWLATQAGLVRFDGERFKVFDTENHPEFGTNWASCVLAASSGEVLLGTPAGLFHPRKGRPEGDKWVEIGSRLPVNALAAGTSGAIWALCASNQLVEIAGGKPRASFKVPGDQPARLLLCEKSGGFMAASPYNAFLLKEGRWLPLSPELSAKVKPDLICRSEQGGFWCAAGREVARLVEAGGTFKLTPLETGGEAPGSAISALMEDHAGCLWAGTRRGAVYCLQPANGGDVRATVRPAWRQVTPQRLRSLGPVSCLYEDSEGLVWVGTTGGYLHQIKPRLVTMWSLPTLTQQNVPHTVCVARDGAVWIGTDGAGAYRYQDGTVSRFGAEQGLSNGTVIAILEDRRTNLWCGTFGGLFRLEQGRFKTESGAVFNGHPVPALFEDRAGDLWFGTVGAVLRKRGDKLTKYSLGSDYQDSEVRAIVEGRQGEVWIGARGGGIFRLEREQVQRFDRFRRPLVQTLHCDAKGNLWVGTATRGLFRVAGNRINNWSRPDGLPSAWIGSILEDSAGTLWLGSNEGVFGVTSQALMARARGAEAPLLTIQVASAEVETWSTGSGQPSAAKGPDGRLWFPTAHGVLSFDPAELMRHRPELPVLIEEVLVDGVERFFDEARSLKLYTGLKRLEFRYTIADLDSPGRLKFRYRLEGLDDRWVDAGAQRSATYGPLAPGNYRFRVISAGSANVWTETTHPLSIRVVLHFWQTAWFRAGVALLVLSAVGATALIIGRAKLRRKLERLEMQHATEKERQRIAQDLHDDLGSGISEIVFLSELARQEPNDSPAQVPSQLANITQKARQLATAMDEIVWTVNPKNDSLPDLASYLCDYAREFLRAANVGCRIDMTESLPTVPLTAQQRHNLFMAVKEALNNAVKHSGAGEVWLRILWSDAVVVVSVEDDGRGFHPAQAQASESGNGLANTQARLEAIGGKAEYSSQPGQGTRVRFTLPLVTVTPTASADSLN
jgi:ligand-binding sensor domain-containing protein/signal transduction histidine kinase